MAFIVFKIVIFTKSDTDRRNEFVPIIHTYTLVYTVQLEISTSNLKYGIFINTRFELKARMKQDTPQYTSQTKDVSVYIHSLYTHRQTRLNTRVPDMYCLRTQTRSNSPSAL